MIEGVLMRAKNYVAAATRKPDGTIVTGQEKLEGIYTTKVARIPFLRSFVIVEPEPQRVPGDDAPGHCVVYWCCNACATFQSILNIY